MGTEKTSGRLERIFGISPAQGLQLAERWKSLTPREREAVQLLVAAVPNRQIAEALGISPFTLNMLRRSLRIKLGVSTTGIAKVYFYLRLAAELEASD